MHDRAFLMLCIGEIGVVSIGQVNLPAAVIVQAVVVLVIFRASFSRQDLGAGASFLLALAAFSWISRVQGHALLPLLILLGMAGLALLIFSFAGYLLRQRSGGPA